jgi:long-chain acyl-CoA synthetase
MAQAVSVDPARLIAAVMRHLAEEPMFALGEAEIRGNAYRVFKNAPPSLVGLFLFGTQHGDKDFLIYEEERLSYREAWSRACRLAHALRTKLGVGKGDRVAIAMRNYPEWCVSYMAVISLGAVVVPLNAWWKTDELRP